MNLIKPYTQLQKLLDKSLAFEGIAPLLLRLYLAPVMLQAGWNKYQSFDAIVDWFGNADYGLGLPFPVVMAFLATATELLGGVFLLLGFATRWISIPLMVVMLVAVFSVHWPNGWAAIADASSWMSDGTIMLNEAVVNAPAKLAAAKDILQEHGNYEWLTSSGKFVVLNNGIEFAMTYFIMLLSLFFTGGGKYTSFDYFLAKKYLVNQ
ncbi:HvfX family Cu-binding RiPP maturation protein [Paraglaciecola arctica]|uniref:HvfX family Cu-binding RiPP maturation protein n=1 Tax=Paraglaciecola arctica TaxID=1128911 RepID=UPI001C067B27|nr:DoxX family protein [Paraglaciecola arctica]MBU3003048.1 DoxX family protein [Paraglaciecola arctica]